MALRDGLWLEPQLHPGSILRLHNAATLGSPLGLFAGGVSDLDYAHGVFGAGDLKVTANGTPNLSVNLAAGAFSIRGTEDPAQGAYFNVNDDGLNVTGVPTGHSTNPTWHLVGVQARNAGGGFSGSANDFRPVIVPGTASPTPADPSITSFPNLLVLARIVMPAGATNVGGGGGQGTIVDLRPKAGPGGTVVAYKERVGSPNFTFTSTAVIGGLTSNNVQIFKGRLYRASFACRQDNDSGGQNGFGMRRAGTVIAGTPFINANNVNDTNFAMEGWFIAPATAAVTFDVTATAVGGTGKVTTANSPAWFTIEDKGYPPA